MSNRHATKWMRIKHNLVFQKKLRKDRRNKIHKSKLGKLKNEVIEFRKDFEIKRKNNFENGD